MGDIIAVMSTLFLIADPLARMVRPVEPLKFGLVFNVAKDKADLIITEDTDVEITIASTSAKPAVTSRRPPTTRRTTTRRTTTTTQKPDVELGPEDDGTELEIDESRHDQTERSTSSQSEFEGNGRWYSLWPPFVKSEQSNSVLDAVTSTTTVIAEMVTRTEIINPTCILVMEVCEDERSVTGVLAPTRTLYRNDHRTRDVPHWFSLENDMMMISDQAVPDSPEKVTNRTVNLNDTYEGATLVHRRNRDFSGAGENGVPIFWTRDAQYLEPSISEYGGVLSKRNTNQSEATPSLFSLDAIGQEEQTQPSDGNHSVAAREVHENANTVFSTEFVTVTKVEKYIDYGHTSTLLVGYGASCVSPDNSIPLCPSSPSYPSNVPLLHTAQLPEDGDASAMDATVNSVYHTVNQFLANNINNQATYDKNTGRLKEPSYTKPSVDSRDEHSGPPQVIEHVDETRDVEYVTNLPMYPKKATFQ